MSLIKKALVPMAGLGTRLFPATLACRKELFPVVGPDGVARPMLHFQLRELVAAGIEQIGLVVDPGGEEAIRSYFSGPSGERRDFYTQRAELNRELEEMEAILSRLQFIEQAEPKGFGHAVLCAREFISGEPFLLCTGDILYRSGCHEKVMTAFEKNPSSSLSAVTQVRAAQLHGYGTIGGVRDEGSDLIQVEKMIEKPSPEVALRELQVEGLPEDVWLGWFGLHVFTPAIFAVLQGMLSDASQGEVQLTAAQEYLMKLEGYRAVELKSGDRFDFGLPDGLLDAMTGFARCS